MLHDYMLFAEPEAKTFSGSAKVYTKSRIRAIDIVRALVGTGNWAKVWIEYEGHQYTVETLENLP